MKREGHNGLCQWHMYRDFFVFRVSVHALFRFRIVSDAFLVCCRNPLTAPYKKKREITRCYDERFTAAEL